MPECIFCSIAQGKIPCAKVFEDNEVLAFLDVNPLTKGHALVIPKKHFENVFDIEENALEKIIIAAKRISAKMKEVLKADGIRLSQSNGARAGQVIFHFHLHIIPRYHDDRISMHDHGAARSTSANMEELQEIAAQIKL